MCIRDRVCKVFLSFFRSPTQCTNEHWTIERFCFQKSWRNRHEEDPWIISCSIENLRRMYQKYIVEKKVAYLNLVHFYFKILISFFIRPQKLDLKKDWKLDINKKPRTLVNSLNLMRPNHWWDFSTVKLNVRKIHLVCHPDHLKTLLSLVQVLWELVSQR